MLWLIIGTIIAITIMFVQTSLFSSDNSQRLNSLYFDLGLAGNWKGETPTPFYKWGWRKISGKQVWAEKVVKKAFKKSDIWTLQGDMIFFEKQCRLNESGGTVNDEEIKAYVNDILSRNDLVTGWVSGLVSGILKDVVRTEENQILMYLDTEGISAESGSPPILYGEARIREILTETGSQILGANSTGLPLELNSPNGDLSYLRGLDAWEQWLNAFREAIQKQTTRNVLGMHDEILIPLKKRLRNGIFRSYGRDIQFARTFRKSYQDAIQRNEQSLLSPDDIDRFDEILYLWQFSEEFPFHLFNHQQIRETLLRQELSLHFRENIIKHTDIRCDSLIEFVKKYPKKVIFFDGTDRARSFLSNHYINHLEALREIAFAISPNSDDEPPFHLVVSRDEIDAALVKKTKKSAIVEFSKSRDEKKENKKAPLLKLLCKQQKLSGLERGIDQQTADRFGWIIDIATSDEFPEEMEQLKQEELESYILYSCYIATDMDFENNVYHAVKARYDLFNSVLDALTGTPIPASHPSEAVAVTQPEPTSV